MRPILVASLLLLCPALVSAYPQVDISWTGCNAGENLVPYDASDHVATISLIGADGDFDGFDITCVVNDRCIGLGSFPDAWRFDAAGCQAGMLRVTRPASLGGCPGLVPGGGVTYESATFGSVLEYYGGPENVTGNVPALLVRIGTSFPTRHLDPGTRYVLAQVHFDMTNTVGAYDAAGQLCACGAAKEQFKFWSGSLTGGADTYAVNAGGTAFWNEWFACMIAPQKLPGLDAAAECVPVPAQAQTWGQVRARYR